MKIFFSLLLHLLLQGTDARLHRARKLQQDEAPRRWDNCLNMTGKECEQHILETLGGDLSNHPIPDLKIKFSSQRSKEQLVEDSWMFGVPTNVMGEVDCSLNDGNIVFPFVWEGNDGKNYNIPDISCAGVFSNHCCEYVILQIQGMGIPLTNKYGKCLSCWVHQEPLEPRLDSDGNLVYVEHHWDATKKKCVEFTHTPKEIQAIDDDFENKLIEVRRTISEIESMPFGCRSVGHLAHLIQFYGRSFPRAMSKFAGLFCGQQCEGGRWNINSYQREALEFIYNELAGPIRSDENCIIIYTDHEGDNVLKVPQIGGSRDDTFKPDDSNPSNNVQLGCRAGQQPNGLGGCMCDAADMAGNESYWKSKKAIELYGESYYAVASSCECPPGLFEIDGICYCDGGYKVWDATNEVCVCPHGVEADVACVCPGPFSGLDWNNVGWIKNSKGNSCILDSECTLWGANTYIKGNNFRRGCVKRIDW